MDWTSIFYGRDRSADKTIYYRPVVANRLEMCFSCEWDDKYFQT